MLLLMIYKDTKQFSVNFFKISEVVVILTSLS